MKKTEEKPLTPYQQSIIEESSKRTFKQNVRKVVFVFIVALLGAGFVARYYDAIPAVFDGFLVFGTAVYIVMNWAGVVIGVVMAGTLMLLKFLIQELQKPSEHSWETDEKIEKLQYRTRSLTVTFSKNSKLFGSFSLNIGTIVDIAADWFLFAVLITVNHPYMAFFHGASLLLQYFFVRYAKKLLKNLITFLPDPLEQTAKTDIDDLMDKLCDPEFNQDLN